MNLHPNCGRLGWSKTLSRAKYAAPRVEELEDRLTPIVALGGDFNSIQYTPDGTLTQLAWFDNDLVYRVKTGPGVNDWSQETVLTDPFDGLDRSLGEQLLYDSSNRAHVLRLDDSVFGEGFHLQNYQRNAAGNWALIESVNTLGSSIPFSDRLASAVGPGNSFHVAFVGGVNGALKLVYGTNASGNWVFQPVADSEYLRDDAGQVFAAQRYLSLAVDSQGAAHIAYTPKRISENLGTVFSQLNYATNQSGTWQTQTVYQPADGTGDAGIGSSIAIGPNGQVAIASVLVDRVATGSPKSSWLLYHTRQANGSFTTELVARKPDGYVDTDGPIGTGFAPMLRFDGMGRPLIAFSDFATVHRPYAEEYAGQIRLATRLPAGWGFATIYHQSGPYDNGVFYPTFALRNGEIAVTAGVNSGNTIGHSLTTFVLTLSDTMYTIGEPPDPVVIVPLPTPGPSVTTKLKTVRKGKTSVLFIEVLVNGGRRLIRCPFQPGQYKGIKVEVIDSNGDGVVDALRVTAKPRLGRAKLLRRMLPVG